MVQGKSPEQTRIHGGVNRNFSSDHHQDKKLKKVRSMKHSGIDSLGHSPTMGFQFMKTDFSPVRNYMKSTRSSDARRGKLRLTVDSPASTDKKKSPGTSKNLNSLMDFSTPSDAKVKKCSKVSSCVKKSLNRATCSSTLKDSKFPAALVLNSEGKSKMMVCPYTYCSLNGHMHGLSSSSSHTIKCFISERRRILKNQRGMDIEALFSGKIRDNEVEKVGEEQLNDVTEIPSDLFAEIYTIPSEEIIGEENCLEINIQDEKDREQDCLFDENQWRYVLDQTSESSRDELDDVMPNLLEYVEVDGEEKAPENYGFEASENAENSGMESMHMDCEVEEEESETVHSWPETVNFLEYADVDDERNAQKDYEFQENGDTKSCVIESMDLDCEAEDDSEEEDSETQYNSPETVNLQPLQDESSKLEAINGTTETMINASGNDLSSKWNITRKMRTEEFELAKEFNPKPPNFLPLEPDLEAEKVDLKHQMMDGRRNAEEWMIDYALQKALTRLGDSVRKKKKVALLVEAFETVVPPHTCESPTSHGTSSFTNLSFIQACS